MPRITPARTPEDAPRGAVGYIRASLMSDQPIIRVRNVKKIFGDQVVLDGINLDVHEGETMVIMGGSGSGKSTLLRIMIGSIVPEEGTVELFGQDVCSLNETELNEVRKKFGILFQSGALFNSMTIAENVALPLQEHTDLDQEIIDIQVKIKLELVVTDDLVAALDAGQAFGVRLDEPGLHGALLDGRGDAAVRLELERGERKLKLKVVLGTRPLR